MAKSEEVVKRRHRVAREMYGPIGINRGNAAEVAARLGIPVRTLWDDAKVIREKWTKEGAPVLPDAGIILGRLGEARAMSWRIAEESMTGEAKDPDTALKALDRHHRSVELEAKVAGVIGSGGNTVNVGVQVKVPEATVDDATLDAALRKALGGDVGGALGALAGPVVDAEFEEVDG